MNIFKLGFMIMLPVTVLIMLFTFELSTFNITCYILTAFAYYFMFLKPEIKAYKRRNMK